MNRLFLLVAVFSAACSTHPVSPATERIEARESATATAPSVDVTRLQGITRILIDASSLYDAAAEQSTNEAYAQQLRNISERRRAMVDVFQARVASLGGAPTETGQALGTAHRVFMDARMLGDSDTKVAVQEALRGENYLVDQLTEAKDDAEVGSQTRSFLDSQLTGVVADRDRLAVYAAGLQ